MLAVDRAVFGFSFFFLPRWPGRINGVGQFSVRENTQHELICRERTERCVDGRRIGCAGHAPTQLLYVVVKDRKSVV